MDNIITFTINNKAGSKLFKITTDAKYNDKTIIFFIHDDTEENVKKRLAAGAVYDYLSDGGTNLVHLNFEIIAATFGATYTIEEVK